MGNPKKEIDPYSQEHSIKLNAAGHRRCSLKEENKYGCIYCLHCTDIKGKSISRDDDGDVVHAARRFCPFEQCPYKDKLDNYASYEDYFNSDEKESRDEFLEIAEEAAGTGESSGFYRGRTPRHKQ